MCCLHNLNTGVEGNGALRGEELFVIGTSETQAVDTPEILTSAEAPPSEHDASVQRFSTWLHSLRQMLRFGLVGVLNTAIDLLALNALLFLFPTKSTVLLLAYNSFAYSLGAVNSFFLNKYWTFKQKRPTTQGELVRFATTTLLGIVWSNAILWLASHVLHPMIANPVLWANASKVLAIGGTVLISFLGMRLWVFVNHIQKKQMMQREPSVPR